MLGPDRELAHPDARRMEDRIGNGGANANGAELTNAARTKGARMRIEVVDETRIDLTHIGIHRHEALGPLANWGEQLERERSTRKVVRVSA